MEKRNILLKLILLLLFNLIIFSNLFAVYHKLGSYDTPDYARGVAISGTTAYVADDEMGLQIIDVSDPENPSLFGSYNTPGYAKGVAIYGTTAYVADRYSLQIIDVSDPENPSLLGSYNTPGYARGVAISGTTAYVADGYSGLQIIDVSDPENPSLLGSYDTPDRARGVAISGTTAYVADENSGLQIIDISEPENPYLLYTILPHNDSYIWAKPLIIGSRLLLAENGWNEILTYDISEPANPEFVASYLWNLSTSDMVVYDNCLITANYYYGISILDLESITPVDEEITIYPSFKVSNYPNPFNTSTTISFYIPKYIKLKLSIYNIKGQKIKTIVNSNLNIGKHSFIWNGRDENDKLVSSGIYFYKMETENFSEIKKAILLK